MADIRRVTDDFAVAPQLAPDEVAQAATRGFRLLINNRPDGESPGQPTGAAMAAAADKVGLSYVHIPFAGAPGPAQVEAVRSAVLAADGPVLAFCRSGTRSITAWAQGQAKSGDRPREELVRLGREAGYDLSGSI
ncbi:TIGR01244 family sulfur transferase [Caulobacter sp. S45]|uniref:TIGR01244 family sulfur transferase n=1 Tax=Caulobacter sp. S45 TaxID=1641861 RepID=UPI0015762540|nr:TIGR01244 family sulfur transferase [Caulobacter sp. S45]